MYVNGCRIDCTLSKENPEGFSSVVSRGDVLRGPFKTILEAQKYAHAWSEGSEPPEIVVTETASESVAVKVDPPTENPPVLEHAETVEPSESK